MSLMELTMSSDDAIKCAAISLLLACTRSLMAVLLSLKLAIFVSTNVELVETKLLVSWAIEFREFMLLVSIDDSMAERDFSMLLAWLLSSCFSCEILLLLASSYLSE